MIEIQNLHVLMPTGVLSALAPNQVQAIVRQLASAAVDKWARIAAKKLVTSRKVYQDGLQKPTFVGGTATVALIGTVPNIVENGMPETDLHDTLLGPNVPVAPPGQPGKRLRKDGGFYRAIPFRHQVPGTIGLTGSPMGRAYEREGKVNTAALGKAVWKEAKGLDPTLGEPYGKVAYGGRLPAGVGGAYPLKRRAAPGYHSTDIYAGMIRSEKTYGEGTKAKRQAFYTTFRMISTGSPGWVRPKTSGIKAAPEVAKHVESIAQKAINVYLDNLT